MCFRMDISVIKGKLVNDFNGIKIGSDTAPKRLIEFVTEGKIQRVIKLLDKDKISLQRGNVMHEYIDTDPEKALTQIQQAFETQTIWQDFELEAVAEYAEKTLRFNQQANQILQSEIRNEAEQANIKFVPTIVLGEHIFDESIDEATLKSYIAE